MNIRGRGRVVFLIDGVRVNTATDINSNPEGFKGYAGLSSNTSGYWVSASGSFRNLDSYEDGSGVLRTATWPSISRWPMPTSCPPACSPRTAGPWAGP